MHEIITKIEINTAASMVWSILLDFSAYPEWNPFVRSISGKAETGARLKVALQPPVGRRMNFRPRVLSVIPNQELRWQGHFLFPGLFDGRHFFQLEPVAQKRTIFTHGELFSGILVPLFKSRLDIATRAGFVGMNEALKIRAEENKQPWPSSTRSG